MSDNLTLTVDARTVIGKQVSNLRRAGVLPATIYGKGFGPITVQIDEKTFLGVYRKAGRTRLIDIATPEHGTQTVLVQDIQRHPVNRNILHADFRVVNLTIVTTADVPVLLANTSPLVELGLAIINHTLTHVQVSALPAAIPQHVEADVSVLTEMEKQILVRDIKVTGDYEIVSNPDGIVASLSPTRQARTQQ